MANGLKASSCDPLIWIKPTLASLLKIIRVSLNLQIHLFQICFSHALQAGKVYGLFMKDGD